MILEDLENALAEHAPPGGGDLSSELPPLTIDGIPVSVDKMTQVGQTRPADGTTGQTLISHSPMSHHTPFSGPVFTAWLRFYGFRKEK